MVYNPKIIVKLLSSQLSYINIQYGQMFYITDIEQIQFDTQDGHRVFAEDIIILQYEYERNNYIPDNKLYFPSESQTQSYFVNNTNYSYVYVVESNSLYKYQNNTWYSIYGTYGRTTVAQTYYPDGNIITVNTDDVTTNGILNDGSVVIRDNNKMICGLLKSDGYVFNINSLIGGQLNLNPSGKSVSEGSLQLNANITGQGNIAFLNGDIIIFGDIYKASIDDWKKQYRLITETIQIINFTLLKAGSVLVKTSKIGDTTYTEDTILTEDTEFTDGQIVLGSKIYKDSIINNVMLKPPFIFDIDKSTLQKISE